MVKRQVLAVLVAWLAAVAVVAAMASVAIGTAGRQVTAPPIAAPPARDPVAPTSAPPTASPSPRPRPRVTKAVAPATEHPDPAPGRPSDRPSTPPVVPVSSTFTTMGGRLRVECTGAVIALRGGYAQPAAGWRVTVQESGPQQVRVVFDPGGRFGLRVVATCVDGGPQFERVTVVVREGGRRHGGHHGFFSPSLDSMSSGGR